MRGRFFSDFYDSVKQRYYPIWKEKVPPIDDFYIGRLRFDTILSKTIILTDAQLLDGAFLLRTDPSELQQKLGHDTDEPLPIEIRARAENLADALLLFVKSPQQNYLLKGFVFSAVVNEQERLNLKQQLEKMFVEKVKCKEDILQIMKDSGVNQANIELIKDGWNKWIEAQNNKQIIIKKWDKIFPLDNILSSTYNKLIKKLTTTEGKEAANFVYQNRYDRSSIDEKINCLRNTPRLDFNSLEEILLIESWYHHSYNCALSLQHDCDNFESLFESSEPSKFLSGIRVIDEYALPEKFLLKLGKMPDENYGRLFRSTQEDLQKWWDSGNLDSLKRGMEPFVKEIDELRIPDQLDPLIKALTNIITDIVGPRVIERLPQGEINQIIRNTFHFIIHLGINCIKYLICNSIFEIRVKIHTKRILQIAETRMRNVQ
jgi:hypothetical protein